MQPQFDRNTWLTDPVWVAIDVAAEALGISTKRAYQIAKTEGWRSIPERHPRQYLFHDIRNTYLKRKKTS